MPKLFEYQYEQIVSDYLSGMTQKAVAEKNGVCRGAVGEIVRARGLETRSYTGERTFAKRKWTWDYSFFDKRNPTVAYWAGFLMADGSLNTHGHANVLVCVLQNKDNEHLLKFCKDIGVSTDAAYERIHDKSWGINLSYSHLPEQLKPWGIVFRKTYEYSEPQVDIELLPHYLRGWVDGDGSVYSYGDGARMSVCGNNQAIQWFSNSLKLLGYEGHIGIHPANHSKDFCNLYIGGKNNVNKIRKLLLVDEFFKLERKWNVTYKNKHITFTHYCLYCGKPFEVTKYRHEKEPQNGKYCNEKCWADSQRGADRGGKHHLRLARKVEETKC